MKKALLVAAAFAIAVPAVSVAQDDRHHDQGGHGAGPSPAPSRAAPPSAPAGGQPSSGAPSFHAQGAPQSPGGYRGPPGGQYGPGRAPSGGQAYSPQGPGGYPPHGGYPGGGGERFARPSAPAFARGPGSRGGGQPFGYGGRQYFRYQAPPYRYPVGYYSWSNHPWRRGEWLPPVFTSAAYYIDNWYDFGLWEPSYGYQWIRVGADAVLINLADGQIADVVPGIYY